MRRALLDAGVEADDVDYVNGHGTGTPPNDAMERLVMRTLFRDRVGDVPISSTKSMTGHGLGAAGAIEAATCVLALEHRAVPPTSGFGSEPDPLFDFVPNTARACDLEVAMTNSYAFGGNNASVLLGRAGRRPRPEGQAPADVLVTGIGAVGAPGIGREAWWERLVTSAPCAAPHQLNDARPARLLGLNPDLGSGRYCDPRKWRRMDRLGQHGIAAASAALDDSGLSLEPADAESLAVIVASEHGPLEACEQYRDAERTSGGLPSPLLFPNIAMNSTSGHIAVGLGLRGPTMTFTGSATCGVHAIAYAAELVRCGRATRALVVAGDLLQWTNVVARWSELGTSSAVPFDAASDGLALSSASVALLLESRDVVEARGGRAWARLGRASSLGQVSDSAGVDPTVIIGAMSVAIAASELRLDDIDLCLASAGGAPGSDEAEELALSKLLPEAWVTAPKGAWGDTQAGAGLAGVLAAAGAFEHGCVPATAGLRSPRCGAAVKHVRTPFAARPRRGLVNVIGSGGTVASLVVEAAP
jgi:3-oxoacyl-[acyl-carrier-protein] synthase II